MSRIGNIHTVVFLPEDCGVTDPTCIMHRNSMASLEDIMINFWNRDAHCATLPMTEILSYWFFSRDLNQHSTPITKCLRRLLIENNDSNNDKNFACRKVLPILGKLMVKERFEKLNAIQNQAVTRYKSNVCSIVISEFRKKWDKRYENEQCLHGNFLDWHCA